MYVYISMLKHCCKATAPVIFPRRGHYFFSNGKYCIYCPGRIQNMPPKRKKGGRCFTYRGQLLYARGAVTLRVGGRCFTFCPKKPSIYAASRGVKIFSTISTISTISLPAPA